MKKPFAKCLWRMYTGKNSRNFHAKKTLKKTFDWSWHFKNIFVSYTSCLVQSIFKKFWLFEFQTKYQEKQDFVILFVNTYCWIWNDSNFIIKFGLEIKTSHTDDPKYFKVDPYHLLRYGHEMWVKWVEVAYSETIQSLISLSWTFFVKYRNGSSVAKVSIFNLLRKMLRPFKNVFLVGFDFWHWEDQRLKETR